MNEDMSEILNKITSMMDNNKSTDNSEVSGSPSISPETISQMVQMLGNKNNTSNDTGTENNESNSAPNIDFETIMKFKHVFDKMNNKDDPRAKLLLALKPYLKDSRKEKVEQYIQFFNLSKVIDIFGNTSGGDPHK